MHANLVPRDTPTRASARTVGLFAVLGLGLVAVAVRSAGFTAGMIALAPSIPDTSKSEVSCAALPLADKATFLAYVKTKTANNKALNEACGGDAAFDLMKTCLEVADAESHRPGHACHDWAFACASQDPNFQTGKGAETSNDLVLWSGVSGEKENGPPNMFAKEFPAGEDPAVMASHKKEGSRRPLVQLNLVLKRIVEGMGEHDWESKDPTCNGYSTAESWQGCKDGCGYSTDVTIQPWRGGSSILVERSAATPAQTARIYVLIAKFSPTNVFAIAELPALITAQVDAQAGGSNGAGVKTIEFRLKQGAEYLGDGGGAMTCGKIYEYLASQQYGEQLKIPGADNKPANGKRGSKVGADKVHVRCRYDCTSSFNAVSCAGQAIAPRT